MSEEKVDVLTQGGKTDLPSVHFSIILFYSSPQQVGHCQPTLVREDLYSVYCSNAHLFQKHPPRRIQKEYLTSSLRSPEPYTQLTITVLLDSRPRMPFIARFPATGGSSLRTHITFRCHVCVCVCSVVSEPMDCSLPGFSVHGIFQARILEWVAISYSRGSPRPRDRTHVSCVSCIGRQVLYHQCHLEASLY